MNTRAVAIVAVLVAALALLALNSNGELNREPFDPDSVGPLGYQGLVRLVRELGSDIDTSLTDVDDLADIDVVVIVQGDLDEVAADAVDEYVTDGGVVVVLDPTSLLAPVSQTVVPGESVSAERRSGDCDEPALSSVDRLEAPSLIAYGPGRSAATSGAGDDAVFESCFRQISPARSGAAEASGPVSVADIGPNGGVIVAIDPTLWVNDHIAQADNAVLAAAVLAPADGTRVGFLERTRFATGDRSLWSLIDDGVRWGLLQVVLAGGLLMWWRGRRLGRPVPEVQPVALDGSDLVVATGALLQRSHRSSESAARLYDELHRLLVTRLGVAPGVPTAELAALVATRFGIDIGVVGAALSPATVTGEASLVTYSRHVRSVRHAVRPAPSSAAPSPAAPSPAAQSAPSRRR